MNKKVLVFKVSKEGTIAFLGIPADTMERISKLTEMLRESKEILIKKASRIRYEVESTVHIGFDLSEDFIKAFDPTTDKKSISLNFPGFEVISKDNDKNKILLTDEDSLLAEKHFTIINKPLTFPTKSPVKFSSFDTKVDFSSPGSVRSENSRTRFFVHFEESSGKDRIKHFFSGSTFFTDSIGDLLETCKILEEIETVVSI